MVTWDIQFCLLTSVYIILALVLVWYVQFLWNRRNLYIYSWNVPGPFAFPLIGATYLISGDPSDMLNTLMKLQRKFPGLCKLWFGPYLVYMVGEPEHARAIFTNPKCLDKTFMYNSLTSVVGTGILTAPTAKWKKHRKILGHSFTQNILDSFVEIFAEQSNILTKQLSKNVGKGNFDLHLHILLCTFDIICETAFGVKVNIQTTKNVFAAPFYRGLEILVIRIFTVWYYLDFVWRLSPLSRELNKYVKTFRSLEIPLLQRKIAEFRLKKTADSPVTAELEEGVKKRKLILLDMILEYSDFTEDEIREDIEVFSVGGSDTTATTMCFILEMLGMFQDVQQKVYEEVIEVVGEDRDVTASDLPNLKYTERVIKETLRLFPTAPFFGRIIGEDVDLGTTILPAGCSVIVSPLYIHRDPKYWPDPLRFDPDRFLPDEVAKRQPGTYMPFSLGPRNCIGGKFGMMSMKTILSTVIRKYKIYTGYRSVEEIKLSLQIVLKMKDESKVSLEFR